MKLVTWNVQWCCGLDGQVSVQRIVDEARALADFDVLCLQEVSVAYPGLAGNPGHDQPELLREALPGFSVWFGAAVQERGADGRLQQFGNLIATRLPVLAVQHHALPYPSDPSCTSMPRMCSVVTVEAASGPLRIMTTHLEYFSAAQRLAQAQALHALHQQYCAQAINPPVAGAEGGPFRAKPHTTRALLCGDFNAMADSEAYRAIIATGSDGSAPAVNPWTDVWSTLRPGEPQPPTFHVFDKRYSPVPEACDFIFASADLRPQLRRVAVQSETRASDHQPVMLELD